MWAKDRIDNAIKGGLLKKENVPEEIYKEYSRNPKAWVMGTKQNNFLICPDVIFMKGVYFFKEELYKYADFTFQVWAELVEKWKKSEFNSSKADLIHTFFRTILVDDYICIKDGDKLIIAKVISPFCKPTDEIEKSFGYHAGRLIYVQHTSVPITIFDKATQDMLDEDIVLQEVPNSDTFIDAYYKWHNEQCKEVKTETKSKKDDRKSWRRTTK